MMRATIVRKIMLWMNLSSFNKLTYTNEFQTLFAAEQALIVIIICQNPLF